MKETGIRIELYTDHKDWNMEAKIEELLDVHHLLWSDSETIYIKDEALYEHVYRIKI